MTDLAYALGDLFQWTFGILIALDNWPNYLFIVMGIAGIAYWLNLQRKYNIAAKQDGKLL